MDDGDNSDDDDDGAGGDFAPMRFSTEPDLCPGPTSSSYSTPRTPSFIPSGDGLSPGDCDTEVL